MSDTTVKVTQVCSCGHGHKVRPGTQERGHCANAECICTAFNKLADVTKIPTGYELNLGDRTLDATYDKDTKAWSLQGADVDEVLDANAKTVVAVAAQRIVEILWAAAQPAPKAAKPAAKATVKDKIAKLQAVADSAEDGQAAVAIAKIATLMQRHNLEAEALRQEDTNAEAEEITVERRPIQTLGGHGPHRAAAYSAVVDAMGGVALTMIDRKRNKIDLEIHAHRTVIATILEALEVMEPIMEKLAAAAGKIASHNARLAGEHHSGPGCHVRRGFIRGFGDGIALEMVEMDEDPTRTTGQELVLVSREQDMAAYKEAKLSGIKIIKPQKYNPEAWLSGVEAGRAFAKAE